ncbi:MAG: hypothetical protein Greene041662_439 [Candidatus Peregrinibacteria bacterium Greene0416_62]|nr:MAG: hypothetical protein Greene041662_439 [Candidatus Peregrinibacteria bacterium Greene0416_62]TSD00691.1 MAG: hypothetical protein Greene101449_65 [Candidatus Peregrinibacteria bacterium Greene1014_49]
MKISDNDRDMLWGEDGPYSEAKLVLNTRILDDHVSRVMVEVEANINPTTFRIIKKNKHHFANDPVLTQLLETARYDGKHNGYLVSAGVEEWSDDPAVMKRAQERLRYMKDAIMRMHEFVIEHLEL